MCNMLVCLHTGSPPRTLPHEDLRTLKFEDFVIGVHPNGMVTILRTGLSRDGHDFENKKNCRFVETKCNFSERPSVPKCVPIPRKSSSQNRDHPIWKHPYHEIFEFKSSAMKAHPPAHPP